MGLLVRKRGMTVGHFRRYWADVHGPLVARLGGVMQYFQHHLDPDVGAWWPELAGVERSLAHDQQLDGVSELVFFAPDGAREWTEAGAELIPADVVNFLSVVRRQTGPPGAAETIVDRPNGFRDLDALRLKLIVTLTASTGVDDLGKTLRNEVLGRWRQSPLLAKARITVFAAGDLEAEWAPSGVTGGAIRPTDAVLELEWPDYRSARQFYAGEEFAATTDILAAVVSQVNAFRCAGYYAHVLDGRRTLAGKYGVSTALTLREAGALNF